MDIKVQSVNKINSITSDPSEYVIVTHDHKFFTVKKGGTAGEEIAFALCQYMDAQHGVQNIEPFKSPHATAAVASKSAS